MDNIHPIFKEMLEGFKYKMPYRNETYKQVQYLNNIFTVIGEWEERIPEGINEPGQGGQFTDYHIEHCGVDITECLSSEARVLIVEKAEEELEEEV